MGERGRGREREQLLLKGDRNLCKERKEARESHEFVIVVKRWTCYFYQQFGNRTDFFSLLLARKAFLLAGIGHMSVKCWFHRLPTYVAL